RRATHAPRRRGGGRSRRPPTEWTRPPRSAQAPRARSGRPRRRSRPARCVSADPRNEKGHAVPRSRGPTPRPNGSPGPRKARRSGPRARPESGARPAPPRRPRRRGSRGTGRCLRRSAAVSRPPHPRKPRASRTRPAAAPSSSVAPSFPSLVRRTHSSAKMSARRPTDQPTGRLWADGVVPLSLDATSRSQDSAPRPRIRAGRGFIPTEGAVRPPARSVVALGDELAVLADLQLELGTRRIAVFDLVDDPALLAVAFDVLDRAVADVFLDRASGRLGHLLEGNVLPRPGRARDEEQNDRHPRALHDWLLPPGRQWAGSVPAPKVRAPARQPQNRPTLKWAPTGDSPMVRAGARLKPGSKTTGPTGVA